MIATTPTEKPPIAGCLTAWNLFSNEPTISNSDATAVSGEAGTKAG